jgi:hypothetical protein
VKCYIDNFVCLWSCIRNVNTQLLARFRLGPVGRGLPRSPPQQRWHHRHQLTSQPRPHCGDSVSALSPRLANRLARGTQVPDVNATRGTRARANTVTFLSTPTRSCATLPPSTPLAARRLDFIFLQEVGR